MNKIVKKIIHITLATLLVLMPIQSQAKTLSNTVSVSLDNHIIGQGYLSDKGGTMIPLRILSEKLKYNVVWDSKEQTATIKKGDRYIEFTVNYHNAKDNNGYIQLSSRPEMKNNTVYVPLRVVADTLGLQIGYANRTAYISTSNDPIQLPTTTKQIPLTETRSLLLGNGYNQFGAGGVSYTRTLIDEEGKPYQISFAQVSEEEQLVTLDLHYNNPENLGFAKLLLSSLVPTKANEIYNVITTQDIIPLTVIKSNGYQVALLANESDSSLLIAFDASKNGNYIKLLMENAK